MKRRTRIFVGCEGASERSYTKWLQNRADELGLLLHFDSFIAGGGDPFAIVESCMIECSRRQRIYGKYRARTVIFDSDKLGAVDLRDQKIGPLLNKNLSSKIVQIFDHEDLLTAHFLEAPKENPVKGKGKERLVKLWKGYKKPADSRHLEKMLDVSSLQLGMTAISDLKDFLIPLGFKT